MITVVGNKPVMRRGDNEIGVVGDNLVKTLEFSIDRIQGAIDLNDYSAWALIERSAPNGGASYSTMVTKSTVGDKITISLPITANETKDYGYVYASIKFATANAITAFSNYGSTVAGTVKATSVNHGLDSGVTTGVVISGTTNYNGTYDVTKIDANNFYFTDTWVSDQTGWWGVSPIWQTERVMLKVAKGINGETEAEPLDQNIFAAQIVAFEDAIANIEGIENLDWSAITGTTKPTISADINGDNVTVHGIAARKLSILAGAFGSDYFASMGVASLNLGLNSVSSGAYSLSNGTASMAIGNSSHAEGRNTTTTSPYSHSEGNATLASNIYAHAEGNLTIASGDSSHAEGSLVTASGNYSHAEGIDTSSSGIGSHAEGYRTIASGLGSHAEGYRTIASGQHSHAEGVTTRAEGIGTHTSGSNTKAIATNPYGSICGNFGDTTETTLFAVANGTSLSAKSLALNIKPDEAIFSIPVLGVTATALDSSTKLATTAFVQGEINTDVLPYTGTILENKIYTLLHTQVNQHDFIELTLPTPSNTAILNVLEFQIGTTSEIEYQDVTLQLSGANASWDSVINLTLDGSDFGILILEGKWNNLANLWTLSSKIVGKLPCVIVYH